MSLFFGWHAAPAIIDWLTFPRPHHHLPRHHYHADCLLFSVLFSLFLLLSIFLLSLCCTFHLSPGQRKSGESTYPWQLQFWNICNTRQSVCSLCLIFLELFVLLSLPLPWPIEFGQRKQLASEFFGHFFFIFSISATSIWLKGNITHVSEFTVFQLWFIAHPTLRRSSSGWWWGWLE